MDTTIKKPAVTVFMPVYNGEKYLKESMDSILNQTFRDFEFLIINDGSTDNTVQIIQSYTDPRIRLLENEKNMGLVPTRNRGIKESAGKFIAILDSDDIAHPKRLEKQMAFLESHPDFGMVGSWVKIIDEKGRPTGTLWKNRLAPEKIPSLLLFHNYFAQSAITLRKSALPEEWYRQLSPSEDYDLWVRIANRSKVWNLPEILLDYRVHGDNIVKRQKETQQKAINEIILSQLKRLGIFPVDEELIIHRTNYSYAGENAEEFIQKREQWLQKLQTANDKKEIYPMKIFSEVISNQWLTTCNANAGLGLWIWKKFWKSSLSEKVDIRDGVQILKFFLKCLLGKNKVNSPYR